MIFAYADPPYLGKGRKHYGDRHDEAAVWDELETHHELIRRLAADWPDGWALSCSTPSLRLLLPACPDDVRIAAWVKPFHVLKPNVRPSYGWEPVIFRGGRRAADYPPPEEGGGLVTPRDFLVESAPVGPGRSLGLPGAKPHAFNLWVLDLLGFLPDRDRLDDLYPGTGGMARAISAPQLTG